MKFRIYTEIDDIPLTESHWDELVAQAGLGGIFLQHLWLKNWWKYFGHQYRLQFVTAEDGGQVIAFAPMMIDSSRTLRFMGDMNSDYLGFVVPRDHPHLIQEFLGFLHRSCNGWRVAHLRNIPRESLNRQDFIGYCRASGLRAWNNYTVTAPFLPVSGNRDGIQKLFAKYSIRRSEKKLARLGPIKLVVFSGPNEAAPYWEIFARQHIDRCRTANRESSFKEEAYLSFLKTIFAEDPSRNRVHFSGLFAGDRPLAFHFGFVSQNRLLWYKPSFDTAIGQGSPGVALIQRLVEETSSRELAELDFTIGEESFKDRFCSNRRMVDTYRVHRNLWRYAKDVGYWSMRQRLKGIIK